MSKSQSALFTLSTLTVIAAALCAGCYSNFADDDYDDDAIEDVADESGSDRGAATVTPEEIAGRRARVLWEAAYAMVGWDKASSYTWPSPTNGSYTLATYAYVASDAGAWSAAFKAYSSHGVSGYDATCTVGGYSCNITIPPSNGLSAYACQGRCTSSSVMHGGQCKIFNNLVLYRSGVYHGDNWAFVKLPADSDIASKTNAAKYPLAKKGGLKTGDVIRRPYGHSALVVKIISTDSVLVFDSNWINGGDGSETVGTHVMSFTGKKGNSDLTEYRLLNCVYDGTC